MDRIEYHVGTTQNHVQEGRSQLKQAESYQTKARKVGGGVKWIRENQLMRSTNLNCCDGIEINIIFISKISVYFQMAYTVAGRCPIVFSITNMSSRY